MTTYYAYFEQGGGCDYTLACGKLLAPLKATAVDEAIAEIRSKYECCFRQGHEYEVASVRLFQVSDATDLDIAAIRRDVAAADAAEKQAELEFKERAQLEKLQAKYGGKP